MKVRTVVIVATAILLGIWVRPAYAGGTTCKATTIQEVSQCVAQLNAGSVSSIEITNKISCNETNQCRFIITTTTGGLIFGTPGAGAGFSRSGDYTKGAFSAPVFRISSASNVTISNLSFDDDVNSPNQPFCIVTPSNDCIYPHTATNPTTLAFWNNPQTFPFITVENSNTITLSQLSLTNCKRDNVVTTKSNSVSIVNSRMENSFLRGMDLVSQTGGVIEGNYFNNNSGAGIITDGLKNATIKNNFFLNNQTHPPWAVGGGQLNSSSENLIVTGNTFMRTVLPVKYNGGSYGGGIELHTSNMNLTIQNNSFIDKVGDYVVGPAIYNDPYASPQNPGSSTYVNVTIDNNRMDTGIDNTGFLSAIYDFLNLNLWNLGKNCFNGSAGCPINSLGTLSVSPNPCSMESGKATCSVAISWYTNFATNVEVKAGTTTIATGVKGSIVFDKVTIVANPITLWGDGTLLATQNVTGLSTSTPTPTHILTPTPTPTVSKAPTPTTTIKLGDLNGDGKVDIFDYNIIIADFGKTGSPGFSPADINRDGKVDIFDYNILIGNFGK